MKLDDVQSGVVYLDTNILYMYLRSDPSHLPVIKSFLNRVIHGQITAVVGVPVLDELFYRLLLARIKDTGEPSPLNVLRNAPAQTIAAHHLPIETALRKLMSLPHLEPAGIAPADWAELLNNIRLYSLLPRDSLHLTIIQRLGITAIASDDVDFDRVASLERHWIFNPPN